MKKIVDERGRLFGRISVIDFIVIAVVIVLAVAAYYKYHALDATSKSAGNTPITYQLQISGVRKFTVDNIKPGDTIYDLDNDNGNSIGTVTDVTFTPAQSAVAKEDGTYILGTIQDSYDVIVSIKATGTVTDGRSLVNKTYELNVNSERNFYSKYSSFKAKIIGIK